VPERKLLQGPVGFFDMAVIRQEVPGTLGRLVVEWRQSKGITTMKPPRKPYTFHPACLAFPLLPDAELQELAEDIKLCGLLNPIVVYRGQILDGRNRLAACELAGVAPRFIEWSGSSPVEWVISVNLHRRHLSASQRAVVALDILPLLEKEANQRQRLGICPRCPSTLRYGRPRPSP
jgi:hypothetical protein